MTREWSVTEVQGRKIKAFMSAISVEQVSTRCASLISRYPLIWSRMIEEWSASSKGDFAWLMYSANYLFQTGGVRWAIDPMTLGNRVLGAPFVDVAQDLKGLSFVLLTHEHRDHLDLDLLQRLRGTSIQWIIPSELLNSVLGEVPLSKDCIIVPVPCQPVELCGLRITPFPGLHWDVSPDPNNADQPVRGVPSTGYLVKMAEKRWLFPGDTRMYDKRAIQSFGPVDAVFAHLWLGRGCALMKNPPLTKDFCRFSIATTPRKIVITHLEECGREAEDYWTRWHAALVSEHLNKMAPDIEVIVPRLGEAIRI